MAIDRVKPELNEEERKTRRKVFWISFAIAFAVSILVAVGSYFLSRGRFDESLWEEKALVIWTDTVSIPMVMFFLVWCLLKLTDYGAFDAIVYSVRVAFTAIFHSNIRKSKTPATYREYREMKHGKARMNASFLLWVALPYLVATIVMIIIYFVNK